MITKMSVIGYKGIDTSKIDGTIKMNLYKLQGELINHANKTQQNENKITTRKNILDNIR